MLVCAPPAAAAEDGAQPAASAGKPTKTAHTHTTTLPLPPGVMPEQFAPPQEAFASFPESAAAASAPSAPSACQLRLAKLAVFQALGTIVGPGDCGAPDAVLLQSITLADQAKIAVTPPATLRCPMAEQIANWVRDDVSPSLVHFGPPLRGLDNFDSYECRGRNRVRAALLSEHGRADALDVRDFKLADGRELGLTDVNVDKDWRKKSAPASARDFRPCSVPDRTATTKSTSISISPSGTTATRSANGMSASRRSRWKRRRGRRRSRRPTRRPERMKKPRPFRPTKCPCRGDARWRQICRRERPGNLIAIKAVN